MIPEDIYQSIGRIEGKLDTLTSAFLAYQLEHNLRHTVIDIDLNKLKADINMAKGAKGAILAMVATISALISACIAIFVKWIK